MIQHCATNKIGSNYCSLTPTCKGWGCRFLSTPIEFVPITTTEKAELFTRVYKEAKEKGILECPHYRPLFIDEVLDNHELLKQLSTSHQT